MLVRREPEAPIGEPTADRSSIKNLIADAVSVPQTATINEAVSYAYQLLTSRPVNDRSLA